MSTNKRLKITNGWQALLVLLAIGQSTSALGVDFVPYAGKREVTVARIDAPNIIAVTFNTDAYGFTRTLRVHLPGLVVAQDTPQADECERAAARKAMGFTEDFLAAAKKIYVQDMRMADSADDDATSPILTDKGGLSAALIKEGIARKDTVAADVSWCK